MRLVCLFLLTAIFLASLSLSVDADLNNDFDITGRVVSPPSNLNAALTPTETVNLTWLKGSQSDSTLIMRKPDSYPSSHTDGTEVYNSTSESFIDGFVVVGNHYYYRAFSYKSPGLYTSDFVGDDIIVTASVLFDIRNIIVLDSTIPDLSMICTVENEGMYESDITVHWNLTKTEDGTVLDSGSDTFAVDAGSDTIYSIFPSTLFLGDVKISFYGNPIPASAYLVFHTSTSGGGSLGGGGVSSGATPSDDIISQITPSTKLGSQDTILLLLSISIISAAIIVSLAINKSSSKKGYSK